MLGSYRYELCTSVRFDGLVSGVIKKLLNVNDWPSEGPDVDQILEVYEDRLHLLQIHIIGCKPSASVQSPLHTNHNLKVTTSVYTGTLQQQRERKFPCSDLLSSLYPQHPLEHP